MLLKEKNIALGSIKIPYIVTNILKKSKTKRIINNYQLYIFLVPAILYIVIFKYIPMYGVQIAFRDFIAITDTGKGIYSGSPWVGFQHFERFFMSPQFWKLIKNTLGLGLYSLFAGFPIPFFLALLLNHLNNIRYKKFIQTVIYAPHFISTVVLVGIILIFLSPRVGLISHIHRLIGMKPIFYMAKPKWFSTLYVFSGVWQNAGWGTIIYLAALSSINPELYESSIVDGANKLQRIWYIDIPGILPTAIILLILNCGRIMSVGFEKIFLMQNPLNIPASEVISTYVYKTGLLGFQYSYSAAIGLFDSLINLILLTLVNNLSRKFSSTSLW